MFKKLKQKVIEEQSPQRSSAQAQVRALHSCSMYANKNKTQHQVYYTHMHYNTLTTVLYI